VKRNFCVSSREEVSVSEDALRESVSKEFNEHFIGRVGNESQTLRNIEMNTLIKVASSDLKTS